MSTTAEVDELLAGPPDTGAGRSRTADRPRVEVHPDHLGTSSPDGVVVSRDLPTSAIADMRTAACAHGHFFASAEAAAGWRSAHLSGQVRPLAEEFEHVLAFVGAAGWWPDAG